MSGVASPLEVQHRSICGSMYPLRVCGFDSLAYSSSIETVVPQGMQKRGRFHIQALYST